ncbi:MAG: hypothetical protein ACJASQ_002052 [Crocinitomicaceae bacterium]|jgi:hypothetical protein
MRKSPKASRLTLLFLICTPILSAQQVSQDKWTAKVYPNPSVGLINIELTGEFDEYTHVNIVEGTGKSVYVDNVLNDRIHSIDLSAIPKGIYTIQMMSTNVYKKQMLVLQ